MRTLLILFLCSFAKILAIEPPIEDSYRHFVKEALFGGQYIKLDDGSIWKVREILFNDYITEAASWQSGDEVLLCTADTGDRSRRMSCWLKNLRTFKKIGIETYPEEPPLSKHLREIVAIHPKGYFIELDDGSVWGVDWGESWVSYNWKKGERVSVFKEGERVSLFREADAKFDQTRHIIINFDQPTISNLIDVNLFQKRS